MTTELEDLISNKKIKKTDKLLLILYHIDRPLSTAEIKKIAMDHGWRGVEQENISAFLNASRFATLIKGHWKINSQGKAYIIEKKFVIEEVIITPIIKKLEETIKDVKDQDYRRFLGEALECLKIQSYRSAIVLSWVGAIYLLQKNVFEKHIKKFNIELLIHYPKEKIAKDFDDFLSLKDGKFLSIINKIKLISDGEYKELKACLDRRNEAGHPNSTVFDELTTAHHISQLSKIIFQK